MKRAIHANSIPLRHARRDTGEKLLIALETFTGVTALAGGALLVARPDGSLLQVAPSALSALTRNSPFPDFLIPGMVLAVVVGGGMLSAASLLYQRRHYALEAAMAVGTALAIFEIVEYTAIGFMPLQVFEGLVGVLVLSMAARLRLATLQPRKHTPHRTAV